jgi:hypothetical protein
VSCWDIPDVSESFVGGCRVTNTGLKNRTERAIFVRRVEKTTDQRGRLLPQVADANTPVRSAPRWPRRSSDAPPRAGANAICRSSPQLLVHPKGSLRSRSRAAFNCSAR